MKKNVFIMSALALSALVATSCTKPNEEVQVGGEATVVLTAQLPNDLQNRANGPRRAAAKYGDGKTATTLDYAVYQVTDNAGTKTYTLMPTLGKTDEPINLSATVKLQLVNGNTYAVVFWADAPTSIYTFTAGANAATVTADYTYAAANVEAYDAFYAMKEFTLNGALQEIIDMKRPFAQLNIGTADLAASKAAGVEVTQASIKVKTYNTLDLIGGDVSGENEVSFALAALPTGETFPVSGYEYLTMNYLLMPADKKADNTITISYDNTAAGTRTFNNVPLQRNYRTNIYGNLLTGTAEFNIIIKPEFDGEKNIEVWDGTTVTEPALVGDAYIVTKAAEWAWLTGKTITKNITLTNDIDFGGYSIKPICPRGITFEGNDHILSNMNIVANPHDNYSVGLFYGTAMQGATLKNFTLKDTKVVSTNATNGYAGIVLGDAQGSQPVTIDNVHVLNGEVSGVQSVGGIVGFSSSSATLNISNCSVKSTKITNLSVANESGFVASLVGRVVGTANLSDCVLDDITIDAYYAARRGETSIDKVAAVNNTSSALTTSNITGEENVTVTKTAIE